MVTFRFGSFFLRNRNFLLYWIGTFAYYNGMKMAAVARGWLVYLMTDSALLLGIAFAFYALPHIIIPPIAGVYADRMSKRKLLFSMQVLLGADALVTSLLLFTGSEKYWNILILFLFWGLIEAFAMPPRLAIVSELTSKEEFPYAYSLYYFALHTMIIAGPLIAGFFIDLIGIGGVYLIIVASEWLFLILLPMIKTHKMVERPAKQSILGEMRDLIKYVRTDSTILILTIIGVAYSIFVGPSWGGTFMPIFADEILDMGVIGLGMLMSSLGLGAMIGSVLATILSGYRKKGLLVLSAGIFQGFLWVLFTESKSFYLSLVLLGLIGVGTSIFRTLISSLYQLISSDETRGRITSLYLITYGFTPIGAVSMSTIADLAGVPFATSFFTTLFCILCILTLVLSPKLRQLSTSS